MRKEFNDFKQYLQETDKSQNTIRGYLHDIDAFAEWFMITNHKEFVPEEVTPIDLREYRQQLLLKKRAHSTANRHLASLSAYFSWLLDKGKLRRDPSDDIKALPLPDPQPRWLDKREQFTLMRAVEKDLQLARQRYPKRWKDRQRDYTIMVLMLNTGLRLSEVVALEVSDLEMSERKGSLLVRKGKGNKQRTVPLNVDARKALRAWLDTRPIRKNNDFVFIAVSRKGTHPITSRTVQRVVKRYGKQAELPKVTPHILRHTFAKNLVNSGVTLEKVAALLGHKSLNTTRIYITPSLKDLEKAVAKVESE